MNTTVNITFWILEETADKSWWIFKLDTADHYTSGICTTHTDSRAFASLTVDEPHRALWQSHRLEDARKLWNDIHLRGGHLTYSKTKL
jgi:hypothetical protein